MSVPMPLSLPMPMPLPNGPRSVGPADPLTGYVSSAVPRVPGCPGRRLQAGPLSMYLVSRIISSAMYHVTAQSSHASLRANQPQSCA